MIQELILSRKQEIILRSENNRIVFLREGTLNLNFCRNDSPSAVPLPETSTNVTLSKGEMLLLTHDTCYELSAAKKTRMLVVEWDTNLNLRKYIHFRSDDKLKSDLKNDFIGNRNGCIHSLPTEKLEPFLRETEKMIGEQVNPRFIQLRLEQLFALMGCLYSEKEVCDFFISLLTSQQSFSKWVAAHAGKFSTVKDMAEAYGMTKESFSKYFLLEFGFSPAFWLRNRRREMIRYDVLYSDMPIDEICRKYAFANKYKLYTFCNTQLGTAARKMRKMSS